MGKHLDLLQAAAGEVQLSSSLGRWAQAVSLAKDGGGLQMSSDDLMSLLQAAGGEVQLSSAFGRWAQAVSEDPRMTTTDFNKLLTRVDIVNAVPGLAQHFSFSVQSFATQENFPAGDPSVTFILSSPLDGTTIVAPEVAVNQDTHGAMQNEPAIVIDPNNPNRIVVAMNDLVMGTWDCTTIDGLPCSRVYTRAVSAYFSNDGGATWCCVGTDPQNLGTIPPGIVTGAHGPYDGAGDPSLAFNSLGEVFICQIGLDRFDPKNAIAVSKGTFGPGPGGALTWANPTFVATANFFSTFHDKPWMAIDARIGSLFQDRIYVAWTRFVFNPLTGAYIQSQIMFSYSVDGGAHFTEQTSISDAIMFSQGAYPVVAPNGTLYVFWEGSTRQSQVSSIYVVKSSDGGVTWSSPIAVSTVADSIPLRDTTIRVASFPAAAVDPTTGDLYVVWTTEVGAAEASFVGDPSCQYTVVGPDAVAANCHNVCVWSKSTDGGTSWSAPQRVFPSGTRTAIGYPVTNPDGTVLNAPAASPIEDLMPAVAVSPAGVVYISAYRGTIVSPWQSCAQPQNSFNCLQLGNYIHNTRLEYWVKNLTANSQQNLSTQPVNSRYNIGVPDFMGDYTDLKVGSDGTFHAVFCDTNRVQQVHWLLGTEWTPFNIHQEDIVTRSGI